MARRVLNLGVASRLWILSELFYPDQAATGHNLTQLAAGLAPHWNVSVLCGWPTSSARGSGLPQQELYQGVHIRRCWSTRLSPHNVLPRLLNHMTVSTSILMAGLRSVARGDRLLVVTNPPVLPFVAAIVCWLRGARGVLLIHDLYPDVLAAVGWLKPDGWLARLLWWLNIRLFRQFAALVVLGRDVQARVEGKLVGQRVRVEYIPNWAEINFIRPMARGNHPWLEELGLAGKFVVQYSGTLGRIHGLECLLAAAQQLSQRTDIHFLIVGAGARRAWLARSVARMRLPNVTLHAPRPREQLSLSLNGCDVAVILLKRGLVGVSVPSRLYNVMASGKPIVAAVEAHSELAAVISRNDLGWVVPPDQPARLVAALLEAHSDARRLATMGARARACAEEYYSFERILSAYQTLMDELVPEQKHE